MGGNPTNRATLDKGIPFVGFREAADDIECRRLAAATGSQKREESAFDDSQVDTRQDGHAYVVRRQAPKLDLDPPAVLGPIHVGPYRCARGSGRFGGGKRPRRPYAPPCRRLTIQSVAPLRGPRRQKTDRRGDSR